MDSVPLVASLGQVPSWAIGSDAFKEADTTGITMPVTKHNELVLDADRIPGAVAEAFRIAASGRPGLWSTCPRTSSRPPPVVLAVHHRRLPGYR